MDAAGSEGVRVPVCSADVLHPQSCKFLSDAVAADCECAWAHGWLGEMRVAMRNVGRILLVSKRWMALVVASLLWISSVMAMAQAASSTEEPLVNDSHFHLTNYIQEGADIHEFLKVMGNKVGRVALFGIPLQQQWSYENSGDLAPTYYLQTDSPLYYYSFTDAYIAMTYRSLSKEEQARFEPMITGFNPTDMYAADHIR